MDDSLLTASNIKAYRSAANRRRAALSTADCSTYLLQRRRGQNVILCLCCGLASHNFNDIQQKFCGFCGEFHISAIDYLESDDSQTT